MARQDRPKPALETADDLTAVIVYDRARGARQVRTFLVTSIACVTVAAVCFVMTALGMPGIVWLGVFFGVIALIGAAVLAIFRVQIGSRVVGFSPRGVFVPALADPVGWDEIAGLSAVRYANRAGAGGLGGRLVTGAMSRGGVNDGGRDLSVILKDPAGMKARLGKDLEFLVSDSLPWEQKGAPGFPVLLSNPIDDVGFQTFVLALKAEADARGIPITISTR